MDFLSRLNSCSTCCQTGSCLSANTPRKQKLRQMNIKKSKKIRTLMKMHVRNTAAKTDITSLDAFLSANSVVFSPILFHLFEQQLKLHKPTCKLGRYTDKMKQLALSIHFISPKAYRLLSTILKLPSVRLLHHTISKSQYEDGLNENVFEAIKFQTQSLDARDKNVTLCIDEMSIKTNLFYNVSKDAIIGFDSNIKNEFKPANNVMVVMVQGLGKKWKQSLGYFFTNSTFTGKVF